ncbi:MAG: 50S ribosomal protein L22 [bacterium]|nr:50S ribosomal protein L22 [bacterium]
MEDKQHIASAKGENLNISRKFAVEVTSFIRGKTLVDAKKKMENVIALTVAVPFKRYHMDLGHKRGHLGPGRFPTKVAKEILRLLNSAEMNAQNKGLDIDSLYVSRAVANKGNTQMKAGRHRGRHAKRTHIEIALAEKEKKKIEKKEAKKPEQKKETKTK